MIQGTSFVSELTRIKEHDGKTNDQAAPPVDPVSALNESGTPLAVEGLAS